MLPASTLVFFGLLVFFQVGLGYTRIRPRIVNGVRAELGDFPFQISLQRYGAHDCGGSILNDDHVLTAAHCVSGSTPEIFQVIVGTVDLNNLTEAATVHNVSNIWVHENYQENNSWNNDIAVIKVEPAFTFNKFVAPVKLPEVEESYDDELVASISGFGRTAENATISPLQLKTEVKVLNVNDCQSFYDDQKIRETNICARDASRHTGFCSGDSGGPLSVEGKVIGVVSFSSYHGCAHEVKQPQVFARVTSYIDWIKEHMEK